MRESILCIGGPLAGKVVSVIKDRPVLHVGPKIELAIHPHEHPMEVSESYTVDTLMYRREHLAEGSKMYPVFFLSNQGEGLIEHLLDAYKE